MSSVNPIKNYNPSLDDRPKASITLTIDHHTYPNIVTYLDSGSQINVFYDKDLESLSPPIRIDATNHEAEGVTNANLPLTGQIQAMITLDGKSVPTIIYVTSVPMQSLLGVPALKELNILVGANTYAHLEQIDNGKAICSTKAI